MRVVPDEPKCDMLNWLYEGPEGAIFDPYSLSQSITISYLNVWYAIHRPSSKNIPKLSFDPFRTLSARSLGLYVLCWLSWRHFN